METTKLAESDRLDKRVVDELVISGLAQENHDLYEYVVSLRDDARVYRELAQQAIHRLHASTELLNKLRSQHHALLREYRSMRVQTIRRDEAA